MSDAEKRRRRAQELWRRGARMAREQLFDKDPLAAEHLEDRPSEVVMRHRWIKGEWVVDFATLKVAEQPFAEGSMRQCWYAKKLSSRVTVRHQKSGSKHAQWQYQRNYVLKKYKASYPEMVIAEARYCSKEEAQKKLLEDDVQTQAESKEYAKLYNQELTALLKAGKFDRRSPKPMKYKCVDMLEPTLVYFPERNDYFFCEAYVEGDFRKYNDNAGYVTGVVNDEAHWRATPQAFSHLTFAASLGQRIVVDIQGVGDILTDPQIHTANAVGFGVGNGGLKGIALFFVTHQCNRICNCMGLPPVWRLGDLAAYDDDSDDTSDFDQNDRRHRTLLLALESALDDYGLLRGRDDDKDLGLTAGVVRALEPIVAGVCCPRVRDDRHPWYALGSSCALARHVHKTLAFMFLHGNDRILRTASPASAVFHFAAASLGGDPTATNFLANALAAYRSRHRNDDDLDVPRPKRLRLGDAATRAAALALLVVAVRNISSLLTARSL